MQKSLIGINFKAFLFLYRNYICSLSKNIEEKENGETLFIVETE
jgi:hypothetical protein